MTGGGTTEALPTATGIAAKQAIAALRQRNIAIAASLRRAGLTESDFAARDADPTRDRIPAVGQSEASRLCGGGDPRHRLRLRLASRLIRAMQGSFLCRHGREKPRPGVVVDRAL